MPFKTPEEFFLGETVEPPTGSFDPSSFIKEDLEEPGMCSNECAVLTCCSQPSITTS
jgi:hypothetical protein